MKAITEALPSYGIWSLAGAILEAPAWAAALAIGVSFVCLTVGYRYLHLLYWGSLAVIGWLVANSFAETLELEASKQQTVNVVAGLLVPLALGWRPIQTIVEFVTIPVFMASFTLSVNSWTINAQPLIIVLLGAALGLILAGYSRPLGMILCLSLGASIALVHGVQATVPPQTWKALMDHEFQGVVLSGTIACLVMLSLFIQLNALPSTDEDELLGTQIEASRT